MADACYTAGMGQGSDAATGRPVFLAFGDPAAIGPTLACAGWRAFRTAGGQGADVATALSDGAARIALADLRGQAVLPEEWDALAHAAAQRGAALIAVGDQALMQAALRAGATHVTTDATPDSLALVLGSAACHVDRLGTAIEEGGGWTGPGVALSRVDAAFGAADGQGGFIALLVMLERFDIVNAAWGRPAGDQVLEQAAARIAAAAIEALGRPARVARVAGSEFLVVLEGANAPALAAERIAARLSAPFIAGGVPVSVGCRVAAAIRQPGEGAISLLGRLREQAAAARVEENGPGVDAPDTLAVDLHHAIERGQIELLFQPQVALADGRIVGVEALARWAHPRLGTLGAEQLLAAAAQAGIGGALSAHIQGLALQVAAGWTGRMGTLRLAVNVTAQDIAAPGFADRVLAQAAASGFPADRLTLEVTETGLILDLAGAADAFAALRRAGCRVALDDFGTGYSSLAYLKALPVDTIKIDKAITHDATGSARDRAVLDGVVGIARALGLTTIVEGVETIAQRDRLAAMGCDLFQGFLCAGPIGAGALARLMENA